MLDRVALDIGLVLLALALLLLLVGLRRVLLVRGAGFPVALRRSRGAGSRGWAYGVARYRGERLQWFRTFSARPGPSREFDRDQLSVVRRRDALPTERAAVPAGHLVVECLDGTAEVDLTMTDSASTGLLAWLEAAPPGRDVAVGA